KGTTSPRELGQHYISSYKIKNVLDEAGDTLIVTSLQDTLHSHAVGDITSPNILTVLTWNLDHYVDEQAYWDGATLVLPAGAEAWSSEYVFEASPGVPYTVTIEDAVVGFLDDDVEIIWRDLCDGPGSDDCPLGDGSQTTGASADILPPLTGIDIEKYVSVDSGANWEDADAAPGPSVAEDGPVWFKVIVCNTGEVPLSNIVVGDTDFTFSGVAESLGIGECDESDVYVVPGGALLGEQYDLASVIGTPLIGDDVTDEDPAYYAGVPAAIDIEKYVSVDGGITWDDADSAPGPSATVGDDVMFKVRVCNTGEVPLTGILVSDTDFTFAGVATSLGAGECDESDVYVVPGGAALGEQYDLASVTGTPPVGPAVTDEDPAYYTGTPPPPAIDIEKYVSVDGAITWDDADSAPGPSAMVGHDVMFKVVVCNTGGYTLTGIMVTDSDFTFTGVAGSLDPGECDESDVYVVPGGAVLGEQYDLASVTGTPPEGDAVTDEDPAYYSGMEEPDTFCSVTQGFWGNAGGKKCGLTTTELLNALLTSGDVVVGVSGRSITFDSAAAVIQRLPAGGPAAALPAGLGDRNAASLPNSILMKNKPEIRNVLVGQVVTLTLNLRLFGLPCTEDMGDLGQWELPAVFCTPGADVPVTHTIPADLVGMTVEDLLALANHALGGEDVSPYTIGAINMAVSAINEAFDGCKQIVACPVVVY
nr:hypothetical protein [Phycisphaerae bacterium]